MNHPSAKVPKIVIVGAGISGLSAAYKLISERTPACPVEIVVLESSKKPGGLIKTVKDDGVIMEAGPESFTTFKPTVSTLAKSLGIVHRVIGTNTTNRRTFIGFDKRLHPLPDGFMMFAPTRFAPLASSKLFTSAGKLRMALDLILPKRTIIDDECVSAFVKRRLGIEALERIAEPLIGGIYGGDVESLSARSCVGKLVDLEQRHGSIIRGLWHEANLAKGKAKSQAQQAGPRYSHFASFDDGLKVLIDELVLALPEETIQTEKGIKSICHGTNGRRYDVVCEDGAVISADAVIIAVPASIASSIVAQISRALAASLSGIEYRATTMINLIFEKRSFKKTFKGFGFVIPRGQGSVIRALSFSSNKFANRAPDDQVLLRAFVSGNEGNDETLGDLIQRDLYDYLGIKSDPLKTVIIRHKEAIPQYKVGHDEVIAKVDQLLTGLPGIALAGNGYVGVGIPDCIESGQKAAAKALSSLTNAA